MTTLINYPRLLLVVSFLILWLAAWVGAVGFKKLRSEIDMQRDDFAVIQGATLTLLGLIIGFTFSMALTRYDQRKNYEEAEANAIGTEYVRADLLPADEAPKVRALLREYTGERIRFYTSQSWNDIDQIRSDTAKVQDQLWGAASATANSQPTPLRALVVSGMNDVLNSEGYTQAAWWNRLPRTAWILMGGIALFCNFLFGFGSHRPRFLILLVLPLSLSLAFFLIAEIDSPRDGFIRVLPQNLLSLSESLRSE